MEKVPDTPATTPNSGLEVREVVREEKDEGVSRDTRLKTKGFKR